MDVTFDELKKVTHSNSKYQKKTSGVQQQAESIPKQMEFVKTISEPVSVDSPMEKEDVEEVLTQ